MLSMYVNLGYAVVATDYVGLGTSFRNASFDAPSNATDVINSVKAARKAVAELGTRWIALGEANEETSALFVAELQDEADDHDYLGSVSISGVLDLKVATDDSARELGRPFRPFLAYGIKTVYPAFRLEDVLAPEGLRRYETVTPVCSAPALKSASHLRRCSSLVGKTFHS